mmetsp:Transcript_7160/g.10266  ORF Transcript_7160/g.10266 Transcript_7160/m.10266 type:complete len:87 (-) Transcript_7160:354-614(-)
MQKSSLFSFLVELYHCKYDHNLQTTTIIPQPQHSPLSFLAHLIVKSLEPKEGTSKASLRRHSLESSVGDSSLPLYLQRPQRAYGPI